MHRLLKRQLKLHLGKSHETDPRFQSEAFQDLLGAIDQAYGFYDQEKQLLERTIDLNSMELNDANARLRQKNKEITQLATIDELTGLANRRIYNEKIEQALERAKRHKRKFAIIFIDLDRFKIINDSLGHHIGDLLLKKVASRLNDCMRRKTDVIARMGGDEFTILLDEIKSTHDSEIIAKKILESLSTPFYLEGHELVITASIGISSYPQDSIHLSELLKYADTAMYSAKEAGKNNFKLYSSSMGKSAEKRMMIESALRKALERNEFILHYQPQLDLKSGKICGFEALIRWQSNKFGFISPSDFLPLAEETGLIIPIGEWVIKTACKQYQAWQASGFHPARMAVNISSRQFKDPDFFQRIDAIPETLGFSFDCLELELTERSIMQNTETSSKILQYLQERKIHLSIDDFGTGYSSLAYLKHLPIDKLKIDCGFVRDIETDPDAQAVVEAIIAMAHSLNLHVTAEGVETKAQLDFLKERHCDQIQGYWLSKPQPADKIEKLLVANKNYLA